MDNSADDQLWRDIINIDGFNSSPLSLSPITGDVGQGVLLHGALERSEGIFDPTRSENVLARNALTTNLSYHDENQRQPSLLIHPSFNSTETNLANISSNPDDGNRTSGDGYGFDEIDDRSLYVPGAIEFQGSWDEHQV